MSTSSNVAEIRGRVLYDQEPTMDFITGFFEALRLIASAIDDNQTTLDALWEELTQE